jgi:hypothetical protein
MKSAHRLRICRATIFSKNKCHHPTHQRLISTSPNAQEPSSTTTPHNSRPTFTSSPGQEGEIRTTGPFGSPDYVPRKRGYAPNLPIPSRKFNLPQIKHPKGLPPPEKQAPEGKLKRIQSVAIQYERQLNAMRRGYVKWRYETRQQQLARKREAVARPKPPQPPPFKPTFAEEMATATSTDQLSLEKQLFANFNPRQKSNRVRGEGYYSRDNQAILASQRKTTINEFLALYHTSSDFITTPEALETEILRNFQDNMRGFEASQPESYESILRDVEQGTGGNIFEGYTSLIMKDKETQIYNAMMGTVGQEKPGYDEVVKEIEEALEHGVAVGEDWSKTEDKAQEVSEFDAPEIEETVADAVVAEEFGREEWRKGELEPVLDAHGDPILDEKGNVLLDPDLVHVIYGNPKPDEFTEEYFARLETEDEKEARLAQEAAAQLERQRDR